MKINNLFRLQLITGQFAEQATDQKYNIHSFVIIIFRIIKRNPDIPLYSDAFQFLLGNPEIFPGQMGHVIPPVCFGSASQPPPNWICTKKHTKEVIRRHPNQMPDLLS